MSRMAVLSLSSGIFFVIATLVGVALLNPRAADAAAAGGVLACPVADVSLDQGYGVSAARPVCDERAIHASAGKSTPK